MALFDWIKHRFYGRKAEKKIIELSASEPSDLSEKNDEIKELTSTSNSFTTLLFGKEVQIDQGIDSVYYFLATDLDKKGYSDALINMDVSHMRLNLDKIIQELLVVIQDAQTFYNKRMNDFDFHINSRNDLGMTTTASEIEFEKNKMTDLIKNLKEIEDDTLLRKGKCQIIMLSYEIGFKRGLAAITEAKIFGKKIDDQ